jgi:hypothetical protein
MLCVFTYDNNERNTLVAGFLTKEGYAGVETTIISGMA